MPRTSNDRLTGTTVQPPHSVHCVNEPLDALAVHAENAPAKVAVIVDESGGARPSINTFAELNASVNRLGNGLLAAGAASGDRLVWCGPNSLEVPVTIHAARKTNLV